MTLQEFHLKGDRKLRWLLEEQAELRDLEKTVLNAIDGCFRWTAMTH